MYSDGTCPSVVAADGTITHGACPDAYGMVLGQFSLCNHYFQKHSPLAVGTSLICSFLEIGLSFIPPRTLQRIFPPIVTGRCSSRAERPAHAEYNIYLCRAGTVIVMIGASLIGGSGILNWGGGSNGCQTRPTSGLYQLCPTINAPRPLP